MRYSDVIFMATVYMKAAGEVKTLDMFYHTLQSEPDRAYYGYVWMCLALFRIWYVFISLDHVLRANESSAIDILMVTDELFR